MEQGTDEWFAARLGRATASRIADVVAKTRSGWATSRDNYAAELVTERLTGVPYESYTNAAMQRGTELEPEARAQYAFLHEVDVVEVGFIPHPTIDWSGASPDGLVGADGLVEIKVPNSATHIRTLDGEPIAGKYLIQMMWQLACTGRAWCDWVSYDPRMPENARLYVERVKRDDELIADLETEVNIFLAEVHDKAERVRNWRAK